MLYAKVGDTLHMVTIGMYLPYDIVQVRLRYVIQAVGSANSKGWKRRRFSMDATVCDTLDRLGRHNGVPAGRRA
jgi:hypothetical protein